MRMLLNQLLHEQKKLSNVLSILVVDKKKAPSTITDGFDIVVLILSENGPDWYVNHYEVGEQKVSVHFLNKDLMYESLIVGNQRRLIDWVRQGEIEFDRYGFLREVKEGLATFPLDDRKKKITIQFTKLLRRFDEGKTLFQNGYYFDAFSNMMHALHHLARLSVIYHGFYPSVTVWEQVRYIEPQTYKLYQELLNSEETLKERIELLILTTEFAIQSKTEIGSQHFLSLIDNNNFTISDMMKHKEISDYRIDLELLIQHLLEKGYLFYDKERVYRDSVSTYFYRTNHFF